MSLIARIIDGLFPVYPAAGVQTEPAQLPPDGAPQPPVPERTRMAPPADVAGVLDARAALHGVGAGWRASLDDLLSLLEADGGPLDRAALAAELRLDPDKDAAALHTALLQRLSENDAVTSQNYLS